MKVSLTADHTGKLLRKNEDLQKKQEENNGCKTKKTGDKDLYKRLMSAKQPKRLDAKKTKRILKPESNLKDKEEKPNSKPINKDARTREENGKPLKKNVDRRKNLASKPKKKRTRPDTI
jgi:hypothetical protein